jgi:hypothetical protein
MIPLECRILNAGVVHSIEKEVGEMGSGGYIVVHQDSITFESVDPDRKEIIETIEGYAHDKLGELGVDVTEMETTKEVIEEDTQFIEFRTVDGVKFVATVLEKDSDPDNDLAVWLLELRQY